MSHNEPDEQLDDLLNLIRRKRARSRDLLKITLRISLRTVSRRIKKLREKGFKVIFNRNGAGYELKD